MIIAILPLERGGFFVHWSSRNFKNEGAMLWYEIPNTKVYWFFYCFSIEKQCPKTFRTQCIFDSVSSVIIKINSINSDSLLPSLYFKEFGISFLLLKLLSDIIQIDPMWYRLSLRNSFSLSKPTQAYLRSVPTINLLDFLNY